jgi:hypothetical protein
MTASPTLVQRSRTGATVIGDIRVNDRSLLVTPTSGVLTHNECEHETASLFVVTSTRSTDFAQLPDQRIEFDYGIPGAKGLFQGYVASVMPQKKAVGTQTVTTQEIYCYGASMPLKGNRPRFFTDVTLTEMMQRIVTDNNLGFSDEYRNDTAVWRTLAQTSETDWEMLLALAGRLALRILYDEGVIRLINYRDIAYRMLPVKKFQAAALDPDYSATEMGAPGAGAVVEYMPISQSIQDPSYRTPTMGYLAGKTAVLLSPPAANLTSQPSATANTWGSTLVSRFATSMPALSQQDAEIIQQGLYNPDWPQTASVRIMGDATVQPGTVVQIASATKSQTLTPSYDGMWYVSGVEHQMGAARRFYTVLTLGRSADRGLNWYQYRPFWLGDSRGAPALRSSGAGQWISNWR